MVMAMVMMFNAIFNNISVILWRSVLLVEETGIPGENHRPAASHWQGLQGYDVLRHFQQYFSYIVAVSFIGGGNRSTLILNINTDCRYLYVTYRYSRIIQRTCPC